MSDVVVAVEIVVAPGATGDQDITAVGLGGATPKAVVFVCAIGNTFGTEAVNRSTGFGFAISATERWALSSWSNSGVSTTFTKRQHITTACIILDTANSTNIEFEADFVQFIPDGVRVNWKSVSVALATVTAIFFAGADVSAEIATFNPNGTQDSATPVSLGFEASILFCGSGLQPLATRDDPAKHTFGVVTNNGTTVDQLCINYQDDDTRTTTSTGGQLQNAQGSRHVGGGAPPEERYGLEYGNFSGTGFDVTTRDFSGSTAHVHTVLAIGLPNDVDAQVVAITCPAATGNVSFTNGRSFEPQFAMFGMFRGDTPNVLEIDGRATSGIGVCTSTQEFSAMGRSEDNISTSNTASLVDDTVAHLTPDSGPDATDYIASFVAFTNNGVDLNFSSVRSVDQAVWWMLNIEVADAAPPPINKTNLLVWYDLLGTLADSNGGAPDFAILGGAAFSPGNSFDGDNCIELFASGDALTTTIHNVLFDLVAANSRTAIMWYRTVGVLAGTPTIADSHIANADGGWQLQNQTFSPRHLGTVFDSGNVNVGQVVGVTAAATFDIWHMVAVVFDNAIPELRMSTDGGALQIDPSVGAAAAGTGAFVFGALNTGAAGLFPGRIGQFVMYDRALVLSEIQELYNAGAGLRFTDLPSVGPAIPIVYQRRRQSEIV